MGKWEIIEDCDTKQYDEVLSALDAEVVWCENDMKYTLDSDLHDRKQSFLNGIIQAKNLVKAIKKKYIEDNKE